MIARPATAPTSVPSDRIIPRLSDTPTDDILIVTTVIPAQNGSSQPICMAMPIAIVMARAVLIASLARVDRAIMRFSSTSDIFATPQFILRHPPLRIRKHTAVFVFVQSLTGPYFLMCRILDPERPVLSAARLALGTKLLCVSPSDTEELRP